jgi:hypothetical protein
MGETRNAHTILVEKLQRKKLRRPRRKREGNTEMKLRETVLEGVDWIHLAQRRDRYWAFVNMVTILYLLCEPTISFSKRTEQCGAMTDWV